MESPGLLALVVDCDEESWRQRHAMCLESQVNFSELASNVVLFCNSYTLMHRQNRLYVVACGRQLENGFRVLYPRPDESDEFVPQVHSLSQVLTNGLVATQLQSVRAADSSSSSSRRDKAENFISRALSTCLCVINRQLLGCSAAQLQPRILVAQLSKDYAPSYNNVMNCIFSADKAGVSIDALVLRSSDESQFLQQACYISRGIYQRPADQRDLLQLMLTHCLPSNSARATLCAPQQKVVEFKASCFCHKKPVEFAYMCSVCLALTCSRTPTCATCGTETTYAAE